MSVKAAVFPLMLELQVHTVGSREQKMDDVALGRSKTGWNSQGEDEPTRKEKTHIDSHPL